jgi:hypothetical protein
MLSQHVLLLTDENLDEGSEVPQPVRPFIDHADDVYVIAPMLTTRPRSLDDDSGRARASAEARPQTVFDHLCTCGFSAHGDVGVEDPIAMIADALSEFRADLILMRLNAARSERENLRERRLAARVRAHFDLPAIVFFFDDQGQVVAREDA